MYNKRTKFLKGDPRSHGRKRFYLEVYKIKIKGHLEERWAEWFEEMTFFTHEKDGTTALYGPLPDQAALHSILL